MNISPVMADGIGTQRALKPVGRVGHQIMAAAIAAQVDTRSTVFMQWPRYPALGGNWCASLHCNDVVSFWLAVFGPGGDQFAALVQSLLAFIGALDGVTDGVG